MKKELQQLDKMVSEGKILEAFDKFFHEKVVTWSDKKDKTTSKLEKKNFLEDFFKKMKSLDQSKFHGALVDGNTSYSKFTFLFTNQDEEKLKWHEIIRRKWKNGLVVDEFYFKDSFSDLKKKIEKKSDSAKDKKKSKSAKKGKTSIKIKKDSIKAGPKEFEQLVADQKPIDNTKKTATKSKAKDVAKTIKPAQEKAAKNQSKPVNNIKTAATKPVATKPKAIVVETEVTTSSAKIAKQAVKKETVEKPKAVVTKAKVAPKPRVAKAEVTITKPTAKVAKPSVGEAAVVKPKTIVTKTKVSPKQKVLKAPDLTIIEGIGPKIKELLAMDGITTFAQVAKSKVEDLKNIMLTRGGTRYNANNPATWPEQAALAAQGKWEELKALKDELKFGKRVE